MKKQLRRIYRQIQNLEVLRLHQCPPQLEQYKQICSQHIQSILKHNMGSSSYHTLAIFKNREFELPCLDIGYIVQQKCNLKLALPVHKEILGASAQPMEFVKYQKNDIFKVGLYGIEYPYIQQKIQPDAVIVPLLCFDHQSLHRIGYGKGYYDKTIAFYRKCKPETIFIGLGKESLKQTINEIYLSDFSLDFVVTEKQIYKK